MPTKPNPQLTQAFNDVLAKMMQAEVNERGLPPSAPCDAPVEVHSHVHMADPVGRPPENEDALNMTKQEFEKALTEQLDRLRDEIHEMRTSSVTLKEAAFDTWSETMADLEAKQKAARERLIAIVTSTGAAGLNACEAHLFAFRTVASDDALAAGPQAVVAGLDALVFLHRMFSGSADRRKESEACGYGKKRYGMHHGFVSGGWHCLKSGVLCRSDLHPYLPVGHLAVLDVATNLLDLKPSDVPVVTGRFGNGVSGGVLNRCARRADQLDHRVGVFAHGETGTRVVNRSMCAFPRPRNVSLLAAGG